MAAARSSTSGDSRRVPGVNGLAVRFFAAAVGLGGGFGYVKPEGVGTVLVGVDSVEVTVLVTKTVKAVVPWNLRC